MKLFSIMNGVTRMFFRLCLLTVCLLALNACNQEPVAAPQVAETQAEISLDAAAPVTDLERIMANINELSSDAYGGREPMSEGEKLTLAFIEKQFRSMGLQPMFGDSYQQAVDLVSSTTDPAAAQMTFHLSKTDRLVTYEQRWCCKPAASCLNPGWKIAKWFLWAMGSLHRSMAGTTTRM